MSDFNKILLRLPASGEVVREACRVEEGGKRKVEQTGVRKIWDAQGGDGDRFLVAIWWSKSAL